LKDDLRNGLQVGRSIAAATTSCDAHREIDSANLGAAAAYGIGHPVEADSGLHPSDDACACNLQARGSGRAGALTRGGPMRIAGRTAREPAS
jgi:hypothetical protein